MAESTPATSSKAPAGGLSGLQKGLLFLLLAALVLSAGGRYALAQGWIGSSGGSGSSTKGLGPGGTSLTGGSLGKDAGAPEGGLEAALPVVTEASFFGLIGFALGYLSRKVFKVALIGIALFFLGLQGLVHFEVIEPVDWPLAIQKVNDFILNLKEKQTFTQWITGRVPTAGALTAGYLLGLKRG
jgi:uncharacterized membrane protein (Fun14 family)